MKLGVMANIFCGKNWKEACEAAKKAGLTAIEPGCGGFVGKTHCDPQKLLSDKNELKEWVNIAERNGLEISSISCHGNMLHPDNKISNAHIADFENAITFASTIGVKVINSFAGCPGASEGEKYPNWITCPWPTYYGEAIKWQWEKKLIPFWSNMVKKLKKAKISVGFEMHEGDMVYNTETLLKLRDAVGEQVCCCFDPSNLFWQGINPIKAIQALKGIIVNVHAKDGKINREIVEFTGSSDWKNYSELDKRAWNFRTVGYGHGVEFWNEFLYTLRLSGYDGVISIEHEDPLISGEEGLNKAISFLKDKILQAPKGEMWWA